MSATLMGLITGHIPGQCVYAVAKLGVVDRLPRGEMRSVDALAQELGVDAEALYRVLRLLAAYGIFELGPDRAVGVTDVGEALRDGESSLRYVALLHGEQTIGLFEHIVDSVRSGRTVSEVRYGKTRWELLAEDPEAANIFNRAMRGRAAVRAAPLHALDWSGVTTVVDVGGGSGGVLFPLLASEPHLHGVLFDLEHVAADAREAIAAAGLSERVRFEPGSFFETVPPGGDVYVLSNILHDWRDDDCARILETCRTANARLVVLEHLYPTEAGPHPTKVLDLQMLVAVGGRERTEEEYRALLAGAGFELTDVVGNDLVALVAVPV